MSTVLHLSLPNASVKHLESRGTIYSYLEIGLKTAVFGCLTNVIAPPLIALESCSNPQKMRHVFQSAMKKNLVQGSGFFVSDVISEVVFWPLWLMLPGLGPNR